MTESDQSPPRALDPWLLAWTAFLVLVAVTSLAYAESSAKLAAVLRPERAAITVGSAVLLAVAVILPARCATLRAFRDEALATLLLTTPLLVVAWRWAALDPSALAPLLVLLASQLLLAGAAVAGSAGRGGPYARLYAGALVVVIFGAPFVDYMAGEFVRPGALPVGGISAPWAARPLLLGAGDSAWRTAAAANVVLAIPLVAFGRRRKPS